MGLCCCARAFSSCNEQGLLHCSSWASHCSGFSCCGAWALGTQASVAVARGLSSCGMWALQCRLTSCGVFLKLINFLYSRFLLVINFIHISVYMSIPIAQLITPPPPHPCRFPPLMSICLFSTSVSQLLPCKLVHLYHFSRFHIYALIYDICFSLSDLLHSV